MIGGSRRSRSGINIWPGYVDALSTLLLLFVFVLTVFMLAQTVLSDALSGRNEALARLEASLAELTELLAIERDSRAELSDQLTDARASLTAMRADRDRLRGQLSDALSESERLGSELSRAGRDVALQQTLSREQGLEIARLQQDIDTLRQLRAELEADIGRLSDDLGAERDRSRALEARLADEQERTLLAQQTIEQREIRLRDLQARIAEQDEALADERQLSEEARSRIAELARRAQALQEQLLRVQAALDLRDQEIAEQGATIARQELQIEDLGARLNEALLEEVEELSQYQSEFLRRLASVLGERDDIEIVGDRFRFQSELFFESGSAQLGDEGAQQLTDVADTLRAIARTIPDDLPWILQVEGHTDNRPIQTAEFPSNWQLSTARAQAIVDYLIEAGVAPERLSAAGFAEHHPVSAGDSEADRRLNRRIELRLTSR